MAKKKETKLSVVWRYRYLLLAVIGVLLLATYFVCDYYTTKVIYENPQRLIKHYEKKKTATKITGATQIDRLPDGTFKFTGLGMQFLETELSLIKDYSFSTPILPPTFAVVAYWKIGLDMTVLPSYIGINYTIARPIGICALFTFWRGSGVEGYVGTYLVF